MKKVSILICFTAIILIILLLGGYSNNKMPTYVSLDELKDKRIAYTVAALQERVVNELFPDADKMAFNNQMDTIAALQAGQVDAAMVSYPVAFLIEKNNPDLTWIDKSVYDAQAGVAIKTGNVELLNQVNACIYELEQNGTIADMVKRWYNTENTDYSMPNLSVPTEGKPIKIGISADREPASFLSAKGEPIGLDGELARRIAIYMNRPIEFIDMPISAWGATIESGQVDMIVSNVMISDAYGHLDFSIPYFNTPFVMVVRKNVEL